jgi:hypothetical protein
LSSIRCGNGKTILTTIPRRSGVMEFSLSIPARKACWLDLFNKSYGQRVFVQLPFICFQGSNNNEYDV